MSRKARNEGVLGLDDSASSEPPRRIDIAVSAEVIAAVYAVVEREQVTLTEAVRRLLTYGDYVYRAVKEQRSTILLRSADTVEPDREVLLS